MDEHYSDTVVSRHIELTFGIRSGKSCVKGMRITVADVVLWTEQGLSPDQIVTEFPQLGLADVHAALAYYHDNQSAIDRQIRETQETAARLKSQHLSTGDRPGTEADGDQVPS